MSQVQVELAKSPELRLCEQHRKPTKRRPPGTPFLVAVASRKVLQVFDETVEISLNTIAESLHFYQHARLLNLKACATTWLLRTRERDQSQRLAQERFA